MLRKLGIQTVNQRDRSQRRIRLPESCKIDARKDGYSAKPTWLRRLIGYFDS